MKFSATKIADIIQGTIEGDHNVEIHALAKIEDAKYGDICFLANDKYVNFIYKSNASIIIVNNLFKAKKPIKATLIKVSNPYSSFNKLIEIFDTNKFKKLGLSKKADISKDISIGNQVYIGGQAGISGHLTIGNNVQIGGGSGVIKNIPDNSKVMGYPAKDIRNFLKDNKNVR